MKKAIVGAIPLWLSIIIVLMFCTGVYAAVEPVISVNGMTGTVNIAPDSPITLNVKLSPGEKDGIDADWWLVCNASGKWYFYSPDGKWTGIGDPPDISQLRPTYQGKLFNLQPTDFLYISKLAAGNYTLYFGVDTNMNGKADADSLMFGQVSITVSDSGKRFEFVSAGSQNDSGGALTSGAVAPAAAPAVQDTTAVTRAIEEADIIKVDGTYLYLLNQYKGLTICDISKPDSPSIAGRAAITGQPIDMYIKDTRAYVIVSARYQTIYPLMADGTSSNISEQGSRIQIADISNKANPKLAGSFDLKGTVTDSRIVGNILYVVSSEQTYYYGIVPQPMAVSGSAGTTPVTTDNQQNASTPSAGVITPIPNQQNVYVASIDVSDANNIREADHKDFGGTARYINVTDQAIFIASDITYYGNQNTTITYLDISDPAGKMAKRGSIDVAGSVNDKFKMDYYNGYFRVCTYQWSLAWNRPGLSYLFVIDTKNPDMLKQVGSVKLGDGEQLFATRFDGNRAYMVTFLQKDPLWVIDLSDPANPAVKGELTVPGWSTYIEPKGDRLIALGVDNTNNWNVSVSLFDVSNPEKPGLIKSVSFGDKNSGWSSSTAYNDVKALTIVDDMGLILLPYTTSGYTGGNYITENRLQLVDYSATDLKARGWVSQKGNVLRSRSVSNRLFSVSNDELQVIDATDRDHPKVTADLTLALNITDFIPLANGYGVQVTQTDNKYLLRAVPLSDPENGKAVSETALDNNSYTGAFVNGNLIYLISNVYNQTTDMIYYSPSVTTRIQVMDFSKPESPVKRGSVDVQGNYYTPLKGGAAVSLYPYYNQGQIFQMNGNMLILPDPVGYYGPILYAAKDSATPPVTQPTIPKPENGVKIIDLSDSDKPKILSELKLDADSVSGYFLNGSALYFSHSKNIGNDEQNRPQSKYYLGRVNLSDPSKPLQLSSVNIPGTCIGTDSSGMYAFTINTEWTNDKDWYQSYTFNSLKLNNDKAYLTDKVMLNGYYGSKAVISDGFVYLSSSGITIADVSNPQKLKVYENSLNNTWADIMDVKNRKIFANVSGGMACYNASNPANIVLNEFMGYYGSGNIAYSGDKAYLPMGYYGLWVKSLNN